MYKVYWTVTQDGHQTPHSHSFGSSEMTEAMHLCEALRRSRREGAPVSFITFCSENPDHVGQSGVDSIKDGLTPDGLPYTWVKRRTTALRKDE